MAKTLCHVLIMPGPKEPPIEEVHEALSEQLSRAGELCPELELVGPKGATAEQIETVLQNLLAA